MTDEQIIIANGIKKDLDNKGVKISHVAKAVGLTVSRLSIILNGKEKYVSVDLLSKVKKYVDLINTDRISVDE